MMIKRISYAVAYALMLAATGPSLAASKGVLVTVPVLSVTPRVVDVVKSMPTEQCREVIVQRGGDGGGGHNSHTPEILGAIVGGTVGKEISDSDTTKLAGALLGASIARDIDKKNQRERAERSRRTTTQLQCSTVYTEQTVREASGYNVRFEHAGTIFDSVVNERPGATMQVMIYAIPLDYKQ